MAKIFISILLAACLFGNSTHCFSQIHSAQRTSLIARYKSQIGIREKTGRNDGKDVEKYLRTVGLDKGYAWCAAFVKWSLAPYNVPDYKKITGAAASLNMASKHLYFKRKYLGEIQAGDVGTLYYNSLGRIGHTFFVNGWANRSAGTTYTVEGNTSGSGSRDGEGVYLRIRSVSSMYSINKWIQ